MARPPAGATARRRLQRLITLTPATLLGAVVLLLLSDWLSQRAGDSVVPGGPLDETAHLLTTLLVLWALGPRCSRPRILVPALIASVLIDVDHVPDAVGSDWLTAGTPRPYPHSLLTLGLLVAVALAWRRGRAVLLAIALGLAVHFWRDLSEPGSGVSLAWPLSDHVFSLPHATYLAGLALVIAVDAMRCRRGASAPGARRPARARAPMLGAGARRPARPRPVGRGPDRGS